jgi:hypothetical protein
MSEDHQNIRHAKVHLIHGDLESHGHLEYCAEKNCLEIVLPSSGLFTSEDGERIRLTKVMLDHLEILPDGDVRISY